jgi:glycosyltransferase involved in cell wall biosynthesis
MKNLADCRVAWLLPAMGTGGISFQHLLSEFTRWFPQTIVFTGQWPGYAPGYQDAFKVQTLGSTRYVRFGKTAQGYDLGFSYASPEIASQLLQFKPDVIFANAFSMWTMIALLLKPIGHWKVIITYEGGSPTYESKSSLLRHWSRQLMVRLADAFVVNGQAAKRYLTETLAVQEPQISSRPFLVPSMRALVQSSEPEMQLLSLKAERPIFLFVGQLIPRKGLKTLLEACSHLRDRGIYDYTLWIVGDGEQRQELEAFVQANKIEQQVDWIGKVDYSRMGYYFQHADVFVFPTYDDIWGMVLTEAMAFGKPVLCSKAAGAAEMVIDQENGFLFDPADSEALAKCINQLLEQPDLIRSMGERSRQIMAQHTPEAATTSFIDAVKRVFTPSSPLQLEAD